MHMVIKFTLRNRYLAVKNRSIIKDILKVETINYLQILTMCKLKKSRNTYTLHLNVLVFFSVFEIFQILQVRRI